MRTTPMHLVTHAAPAPRPADPLGPLLDRLTGDQSAYDDATQSLNATLGALAELGVEAHGRLGSHDPIQATDEALREFPAEEIVFALQPPSSSTPPEQELVELARKRYDVEVTALT